MSSPLVLSRVPALRIAAPFALGIMVHRLWHSWWAPLVLLAVCIAGYLVMTAWSRTPQGRLRWRPFLAMSLAVGALALGWLAAVIQCPPHLTDAQRAGRMLAGRVTELSYTDFSMRLVVEPLDRDLPRCRVLVTTRGCDYTMRAGDLIAWPARLAETASTGNPDEMDYSRYLLDSKGIRYEQHLPVRQVFKVGHSTTLSTRLTEARRSLQRQVFNSQLAVPTQHFIAAMLLGDSSHIDHTTRQEFSMAGVAHVLALSGLHVGLIALIIWWLLFPLDHVRLKKLRLAITLIAIAVYAAFTGLSPSVVRATVMTAMVFASLIFYRRSVSLNALCVAALVILVFSPSSLYGVGFQLSFITVGALLVFTRVPRWMESRYRIVNAISATLVTSVVAMLATVALTAHYFHTISLASAVSNLLILPVLPAFMVLGALFLLVTAAGGEWPLLDTAIEGIGHYITRVAQLVNALPLSRVSGVWVSPAGVILYFAIMALVVLWLYRRHYRYLLVAGCLVAALLGHSLWIDARTPRRGLVILNSFSSTPLLYYDKGEGYVWMPDEPEPDSAAFVRHHAGFLARHRIDRLHMVHHGDALRLDDVLIKPPYAYLMGRRIMAVGNGRWKQSGTRHRLALDDIIVTKRYHGSAATLYERYSFDRLVVSGAMHDATRLLHECDSLGLHVHDLGTQGAISFPQ